MKQILTLLVLSCVVYHLSPPALGQCDVTGATGGGGEIVSCAGNDLNGYLGTGFPDEVTVQIGATVDNNGANNAGIGGAAGNDTVTVLGGTITADDDAISGDAGNDMIVVQGGTITSNAGGNEDAIDGDSGNDTITISGGALDGDEDGIDGGDGNEIITITGGTVTAGDDCIDANPGTSQISVSNATIGPCGGNAIEGDDSTDTITLGTGADIDGDIDCRGGTDSLTFNMTVPAANLAAVQAAIAAAGSPNGNVTIEGLSYIWIDCENIVDNVQAPATATPTATPTSISAPTSTPTATPTMQPTSTPTATPTSMPGDDDDDDEVGPVDTIPTLDWRGLALLIGLLLLFGVLTLRRVKA